VRSSGREPALTFTNADVYAHERELAKLHPDNRHIKDKIRQQLQVLRDLGILTKPGKGEWKAESVRVGGPSENLRLL